MDCAHDMLEKVFILHTICFSIQRSHRERQRKIGSRNGERAHAAKDVGAD